MFLKRRFSNVLLEIESRWKKNATTNSNNNIDCSKDSTNRFYALAMFPYPSGRLHMGHVRVYTLTDCIARHRRLLGHQVLHPMGWDAFGLPAENAAIERGIDAHTWTEQNIQQMRRQLHSCALSIDWSREIRTCSPDYYRWTQWIFLRLFHAGLAYKREALVNWDPVDKTVLANEQVNPQTGRAWRSGAIVEKRSLSQWYLAITKYAQALLDGLKVLGNGWPEGVKEMQKRWIGMERKTVITFKLTSGKTLEASCDNPELLDGATFIAIHPDLTTNLEGLRAINPINGRYIPIVISAELAQPSSSSSSSSSPAVVGIPAHNQQAWDFAQRHNLEISIALGNGGESQTLPIIPKTDDVVDGSLMRPGEARHRLLKRALAEGWARERVEYRLRDWLISRQRRWGTPIPIINCPQCGAVPVPEADLPVLLAHVPQACKCPACGGPAERETDTMDTFMDSSWYYLRYLSPQHQEGPVDRSLVKQWMPVDVYVGGIEHAILHLLYARFISKFLAKDAKGDSLCKGDSLDSLAGEPFKRLIVQGLVEGRTHKCPDSGRYLKPEELQKDSSSPSGFTFAAKPTVCGWEKMSKSKYNGVDPTEMIERYGIDTVRLYVLFKAPPEVTLYWSEAEIVGPYRWLIRLHQLALQTVQEGGDQDSYSLSSQQQLIEAFNEALKTVNGAFDLEHFTPNTAVAALMKLTNQVEEACELTPPSLRRKILAGLSVMLRPMAPHMSLELASLLGAGAEEECWPQPMAMPAGTIAHARIIVQIDGKMAGIVECPFGASQERVMEAVKEQILPVKEQILELSQFERIVFRPDRVINFCTAKKRSKV